MKEVTAYSVRGKLYISREEAEYAELKSDIKKLLKEKEYSFKSTNDFIKWFEGNFNTIEKLVVSYRIMNNLIYGDTWKDLI